MSELIVTRDALCELIPHAGDMCLLDGVEFWDEADIRCISLSHRRASNPLRAGGCLSAVYAVEYGAQAMAVHGALMSGAAPVHGYLAGLREVKLHCERLDTVDGALHVFARRLVGGSSSFLYEFTLTGRDMLVATGRLAVVGSGEHP